jgi:hypothetical protein
MYEGFFELVGIRSGTPPAPNLFIHNELLYPVGTKKNLIKNPSYDMYEGFLVNW